MGDAAFWVNLTKKAGIISLLVAGVSGLVLFQRLPSGLRYLTGLAWFGLAVEIVSFLLRIRHQHNLFLIPIDAAGELWLWEHDGPACFLGLSTPVAGAVRIGPVYTPPDRRGREESGIGFIGAGAFACVGWSVGYA